MTYVTFRLRYSYFLLLATLIFIVIGTSPLGIDVYMYLYINNRIVRHYLGEMLNKSNSYKKICDYVTVFLQ